ncbi:HNH endonuclease [Parabacteroides sp. OttesenSCG-928-K15]|nr:HNH endonuclease [Parabacteroides sp. OttesenSCG-928-K15]
MSNTSITTKNQNLLWAISAGRCEYEGCNKVLHRDILTKKRYNSAYIAHIVADKPDGPRGDIVRSKLLCDNISNLMLLCNEHHNLIDKVDVKGHPESRLLVMKQQHEERIKRITDIAPNMSSEIILYGANIGVNNSPLSYQSASEALLYDYYPANDYPIELGLKNAPFADGTDAYWITEETNLSTQFNLKIKPRLMQGNTDHYSVFAIAPQPLLIKLGVLLNDINNVKVYQKHREPSTWRWQTISSDIEYILREPEDKTKVPVLVFSLSATVTYDRIQKALGDNTSIWEITINSTPGNDFLKTEALLSDFRCTVRYAFDKIKSHHGCTELHIFPAMPVSASVELGRVWMPKVDMPMTIYDANKEKNDFYKTIIIK